MLVLLLIVLFSVPAFAGGPRPGPAHFIIEGDTQTLSYTSPGPARWVEMHEAMCNSTPKPMHVIHTGDLIESGATNPDYPWNANAIATQLANADAALDVLDACGIGYGVPAGNHDYRRDVPNPGYEPFLPFLESRPFPALMRSGATFVQHLAGRYRLVVLPYRYASAYDDAVEAYIQSHPDDRFLVAHHDSAQKTSNPPNNANVLNLFTQYPNVIGIIGGHFRGQPRHSYGTMMIAGQERLRVYSNFQDHENPLYPWPVFAGWVTRMIIQGSELCFRSENVLTGAKDLYGPEFCWIDRP